MDKRTLKAFIIELKDEHSKTFQQISEILLNEYDIKMSRQAVCGMYKRAYNQLENNKNIIILTSDIINLKCIGYDCKQIKDILSKDKENLTLTDIKNVLLENSEYLSVVRNEKINHISRLIDNGSDLDDIKGYLTFKGNKPSDNELFTLIYCASNKLIELKATEILAKTFSITENREMLKKSIEKFSLDITMRDIGKELNS